MNKKDIETRIAKIKGAQGDSEIAYFEEDKLWYDVLKAISEGATNPQELARECIKTRDLSFARWYA